MLSTLLRHLPRAQSYPRPSGPRLEIGDLKLGDILLTRSISEISNAIVLADGGSYSHAALWGGDRMLEATVAHTGEHPLSGDRDVYRRKDMPDDAAAEVVAFARGQLENQYPMGELLLLAFLFAIGLRPRRPIVNMVLDALGGVRAHDLTTILDQASAEPAARTCTELVALSYYAVSGGRYAIRVRSRAHWSSPANTSEGSLANERPRERRDACMSDHSQSAATGAVTTGGTAAPELEELTATCRRLVEAHGLRDPRLPPAPGKASDPSASPFFDDMDERPIVVGQRKLWTGPVAIDDATGATLGIVTPSDLQFSPSLEFVGRIRVVGGT